jgi:hypothetical protein
MVYAANLCRMDILGFVVTVTAAVAVLDEE